TLDSLTVTHVAVQWRQVPNLHGLIPASREQPPAFGAERQAANEAGVAAEAVEQRPAVAVPDFHGAVLPRRGDPPALAVRAEGRRPDVPAMSFEGVQLLAGLHVPNLHRVLLTPRSQPSAVGAERHSVRLVAGWEPEGFLAALGVPDLDDKQLQLAIPTGGSDPLAIGGLPGHA